MVQTLSMVGMEWTRALDSVGTIRLSVEKETTNYLAIGSMMNPVSLRARELWGRTIQLKARDEKFNTVTRSLSLESPTCLVEEIYEAALELLDERVDFGKRRIRLLGVGVSGLSGEARRQLEFFDSARLEQAENIAAISEAVRRKIGDQAILRAKMLEKGKEKEPPGEG